MDHFEERFMGGIANFVTRRYKLIPLLAIVLLVLSIMAAGSLKVKTEMQDLLPDDNPQVRSYLELDEYFSGGSSVILLVEGENKDRMIECAEDIVSGLKADKEFMELVRAITYKVDKDFVLDWGLILQEADDLERSRNLFSDLNILPYIRGLNDSFEEVYTGSEAEEDLDTHSQEAEAVALLNQMESAFTDLRLYLEDPKDPESTGTALADTLMIGDTYIFSPDNTMLMINITPNFDVVDFEKIIRMMDTVKNLKADFNARYPDLYVDYTGDVAIQADEQDAVGFDMLVPAVVAIVMILLLFIFSFTQLRSVVFAVISLIFGILYGYGFVGVTLGEVNMLTSMMAVMLIGLGIDYGIQIITNYQTYRADGMAPAAAMRNTYLNAGMGTLLAALTTAVAFFVMAATGTKAFMQFGVVMGMGIISCFVAMFFLLPSLLLWFGRKDITKVKIPNIKYDFLASFAGLMHKNKWITIAVAAVITGGLIAAAFGLEFEYDLMKLEPQDMPSIVAYRKLMEKFDKTPFASMVIVEEMDEARELVEELKRDPTVAEIESAVPLLPAETDQADRLEVIESFREMPARYSAIVYSAEEMEEFAYEVQRLEWNIIEMADLSVAGLGEDNKIITKRNRMIREIFGAEVGKPGDEVFRKLITLIESDPETMAMRLTELDSVFAPAMDRIVSRMANVDREITLEDLPSSIRDAYFDESGERTLVMIYPVPDTFENEHLMRNFTEGMNEISPRITGSTQIAVEWLEDARNGTVKAMIYIFVVVFLFLLLNFRNLGYSVIATIPLVLGMAWMLGLYPLLGAKLNFMNLVVTPLIIGMGIDFGIHLTHRFKVERDITTTYRYTGKAVFLSALTTMIGFGSLALIGKFTAITSMGAILFVGITSCLLTAYFVLPALLGLKKYPAAVAVTDKTDSHDAIVRKS